MKRLITLMSLCFFISCKGDMKTGNLKYLEVKYVAFGINFPIDRGDERVKEVIPYIVKDKQVIQKVEGLLSSLKRSGKGYKSKEIYLRCILHYSSGKESILDYNKSDIRLDGVWYEGHSELIKAILTSIPEI